MRPPLDVRRRGAQPVEHHVDIAGNQVLQRRAGAAVGNVGDEGIGLLLEELTGEVVRSSAARRAVVEFARTAFDQVQKLLVARHRNLARVDNQHLGHPGHQDQRHEIGLDVVGEPGVHRGRDGVMHRTHEQAVSVRRQFGGDPRAHGATTAAFVVDDELLAGEPRELRRHRPGKGVGAPPRREWNHHGHRADRPGRLGQGEGCRGGGGKRQKLAAGNGMGHVSLLWWSVDCPVDTAR